MDKIIKIILIITAVNSVFIQTIFFEKSLLVNIIRLVVIGISILSILIYKKRVNKIMLLLTIFTSILLLITFNFDLLTVIFLLVICQIMIYIPKEKLVKYMAISATISFFTIFMLLFLGITQNQVTEFRGRVTYGLPLTRVPFVYNVIYSMLTMTSIYFFDFKKLGRTKKMWVGLMIISTSTFFYITTDGRGGYYSIVIFLILIKILPKLLKSKVIKKILEILPLLFLGLTLGITFLGQGLNVILSNRPRYYLEFLKSISLQEFFFSTSVKNTAATLIVDNSYLHILIGFSILIAIILFYFYKVAMKKMIIEQKYVEIAFVVATLFYSVSESLLVGIELIFILYFWYLIFSYGVNAVIYKFKR